MGSCRTGIGDDSGRGVDPLADPSLPCKDAILHIAITGSTGLIGSALRDVLVATGHRVSQLVRRASVAPEEIGWDPLRGSIEEERLGGVDAVIHLAGASIGQRWTKAHMSNIWKSRVVGTRHLADALANSRSGPKTLICSSAIGYYGAHRGDELLTERSAAGDGFLAEVVQAWEVAADPARQAGLRVVNIRTGVVQSPKGGILKFQLPLFKLGLGGRVG
ncbi:MAG: NAD-dependent epimerase/dehydratase family protein, partial [Candidatus Dormibacteraceae bacterium]